MPSDFPKMHFRMECLQKNTETRGVDKYANILNNGVEMKHKCMKNRSHNSTKKPCLKTDAKKSTHIQKMTPKTVLKDDFISGVAPLEEPLVAQTSFGQHGWPPALPECFQRSENQPKMTRKSPPDSSLFGTWPGGLREALPIKYRSKRQIY